MLFALALAGFLPDCVPARWFSGDPKSLELLTGSPVSCLLVEKQNWTLPLVDAAHAGGPFKAHEEKRPLLSGVNSRDQNRCAESAAVLIGA